MNERMENFERWLMEEYEWWKDHCENSTFLSADSRHTASDIFDQMETIVAAWKRSETEDLQGNLLANQEEDTTP